MTPQVINNIKDKDKAEEIDILFGLRQEECPVCFGDPIHSKVARVILPCGHMICGVCHYTIVEDSIYVTGAEFFCPLCRQPFNG
jgi:hypothetical protein